MPGIFTINEMATVGKPVIFTMGDLTGGEFLGPTVKLRACSRPLDISTIPRDSGDSEAAVKPDLIVLAMNRRGEYSPDDVKHLLGIYPESAVVAICGPWCEGETRSGTPLKDIRRIPVREWELEFEQFLEEYSTNGMIRWKNADILSADSQSAARLAGMTPTCGSILVAVESSDPDMGDALRDLVIQQGWKAIDRGTAFAKAGIDVVVIDCRESVCEVASVLAKYPMETPVVALLGFPRQADRDALDRIGNGRKTMLVAKPWTNGQLALAIRKAADGQMQ